MTEIVASFTNAGVPLTSPANAPTIRIRRTDTQALVVTDQAMTEVGDGNFVYSFTPAVGLEYSVRADGDPTAAGQVTVAERYVFGAFDSEIDDLHRRQGLEVASPLTVTPTAIDAGTLHQDLTGDGETTTTATRTT